MKKNFLFGLLAILLAGFGFGGISMADIVTCPGETNQPDEDMVANEAQAIAQIGTTCYDSLRAAIEAAEADAEIKMLSDDNKSFSADTAQTLEIVINKAITIDGGNNTLYGVSNRNGNNYDHDIWITSTDGAVTIQNLTIKNFANEEGVKSGVHPIVVGKGYSGKLTLKNVNINSFSRHAIKISGGTFEIDGCEIEGSGEGFQQGIEINTNLSGEIKNTTINGISDSDDWAGYAVMQNGDGTTTITNTYINGSNAVAVSSPSQSLINAGWDDQSNGKIILGEGNDFTGTNSVLAIVTMGNPPEGTTISTIEVNDGKYQGLLKKEDDQTIGEEATFKVSGGKFSEDPSAYVVEGKYAKSTEEGAYLIVDILPINTITISGVVTPVGGQLVGSTDAYEVTSSPENAITIVSKTWYHGEDTMAATDTFTPNQDYKLRVIYTINSGYEYREGITYTPENASGGPIQEESTDANPTISSTSTQQYYVDVNYTATASTEWELGCWTRPNEQTCSSDYGTYTVQISSDKQTITFSNINLQYPNDDVQRPEAEAGYYGVKIIAPEADTQGTSTLGIGSKSYDMANYNDGNEADGRYFIYYRPHVTANEAEAALTNSNGIITQIVTGTLNSTESPLTIKIDVNNLTYTTGNDATTAPTTDFKVVNGKITVKDGQEVKQSGGSSGGGGGGSSSSYSCKNLPANATANNKTTPKSNTNYSYDTDTSKVCTFQCNKGYSWNEKDSKCEKVEEATTGDTTDEPKTDDNQSPLDDGLTQELHDAYDFAHENGVTTMPSAAEADMYGTLSRIAMAKMLSQYAMNVLGQKPANIVVPEFPDVTAELNEQYSNAVTLAYQLGIMGINIQEFRPYDNATRAEFGTALSRMLFSTPDGEEYEGTALYYTNHLKKLLEEKIITNANPNLQELRGYVMIMLKRAAE